jgi:protein-L-isoaspartate(D-aspartate) O-methyltransferase
MTARPSLAEARRQFAEELRVVAHVLDERVVDAFAAVPRQRWLHGDGWYLSRRELH